MYKGRDKTRNISSCPVVKGFRCNAQAIWLYLVDQRLSALAGL